MKKFVQTIKEKYYLSFNLKEKSSLCLLHLKKSGKNLPSINFVRKTNKRKQNHLLNSSQQLLISIVYNLIWERLSCPLVKLITPSIIKSNQLTKIIDYRNHDGFLSEIEGIQKSLEKRKLSSNTISNTFNTSSSSAKEITNEHIVENSNYALNFENEYTNKRKNEQINENSIKCEPECLNLKEDGEKLKSLKLDLLNEDDENIDQLTPNLKIDKLIFHTAECRKQQNSVNLISDEDNMVKISKSDEKNNSFVSNLRKITSTTLKDVQDKACENFISSEEKLQTRILKGKGKECLGDTTYIKLNTTIRKKPKRGSAKKRFRNRKISSEVSKGMLPNQESKSPSTLNNSKKQKLENLRNLIFEKESVRSNDSNTEKMLVKDKYDVKTLDSLEKHTNKFHESEKSAVLNFKSNDKQNTSKAKNKKEEKFLNPFIQKDTYYNVKKTQSKQYNATAKNDSFLKEQKFSYTQDEVEGNPEIISEMKDLSELNEKTYQNNHEDVSFSKELNKIPSSHKKPKTVTEVLQGQPLSSYKNVGRKASFERKAKKYFESTQAKKELQIKNESQELITLDSKYDISSSDGPNPENTKSPSVFISVVETREEQNVAGKGNQTLPSINEGNQRYKCSNNESKTLPETFRTSLVIFDTTDDEARLLVREQSIGGEVNNELIDLNSIMMDEASSQTTKQTKSKPQNCNENTLKSNKGTETKASSMNNNENISNKPWKRNRDVLLESRNVTHETSKFSIVDKVTSLLENNDKDLPKAKILNKAKTISDNSSNSPSVITIHNLENSIETKNNLNDFPLSTIQITSPTDTDNIKSLNFNTSLENLQEKLSVPIVKYSNKTSDGVKSLKIIHDIKKDNVNKIVSKQKSLSISNTNLKIGKSDDQTKRKPKSILDNVKNSKQFEIEEGQPNECLKHSHKSCSTKYSPNLAISTKVKGVNEKMKVNLDLKSKSLNTEKASSSLKLNMAMDGLQKNASVPLNDCKIVSNLINTNSSTMEPKNNVSSKGTVNSNRGVAEESIIGKETQIKNHLKKKNNETMENIQKPGSVNKKNFVQSASQSHTHYTKNDLLAKAVAEISEGVNELPGKEQFKSKMNKVLHNFTVTGQNTQRNNIQRRIKSQEIIITQKKDKGNLVRNKSVDPIVKEKGSEKKDIKQITLKSQDMSNEKFLLGKDEITSKGLIEKSVDVSKISNQNEKVIFSNINDKKIFSDNPPLNVPKDQENKNNATKDYAKITQQRAAAKIKNITNTNSSLKVISTATKKAEPSNNDNDKVFQKDNASKISVNKNLANQDINTKSLKSNADMFPTKSVLKTKMKRKPLK